MAADESAEPVIAEPVRSRRFYTGADRQAAVDHLLHFCRFSEALLMLLGMTGSGRSSVLRQFLAEADRRWQICHVSAGQLAAEADIVALAAQCFVGTGEVGKAGVEDLINALQQRAGDRSLRLLLIDDAHKLSDRQLREVLAMHSQGGTDDWRLLLCVLAGDPELETRMGGLRQADVILHSIGLPPLSLQEVGEFIRFRLQGGLGSRELPLSHAQLDDCWRKSRGLPGRIEPLMRGYLSDVNPVSPPAEKASGLPVAHMIGIVLLLTLLVMVYVYQDHLLQAVHTSGARDDAVPDSVPVLEDDSLGLAGVANPGRRAGLAQDGFEPLAAAMHSRQGVGFSEAELSEDSAGDAAQESPRVAESTEIAGASAADLPPQLAAAQAAVERDLAKGEDAPLPAVETGTASSAVVQNVQVNNANAETASPAIEHEDAVKSSVAGVESEPANEELTASERYLLSLADGGYVLQVLAAASRQSVDDFVRRQENRAALHTYATRTRSGNPWFVVVIGGFADLPAARERVKQLPPEQKRLGPWPRPVAEIKAGIRQYRDI